MLDPRHILNTINKIEKIVDNRTREGKVFLADDSIYIDDMRTLLDVIKVQFAKIDQNDISDKINKVVKSLKDDFESWDVVHWYNNESGIKIISELQHSVGIKIKLINEVTYEMVYLYVKNNGEWLRVDVTKNENSLLYNTFCYVRSKMQVCEGYVSYNSNLFRHNLLEKLVNRLDKSEVEIINDSPCRLCGQLIPSQTSSDVVIICPNCEYRLSVLENRLETKDG